MRMIRLNNGESYPVTRCGASEGYLWISLPEMTEEDAQAVFGSPENVTDVYHDWDGNDQTCFSGYTQLRRCVPIDNGVMITLAKE